MNLFSRYIEFLGRRTESEIEMAVASFLPRNSKIKFLDCGSDNGIKTINRANIIGTSHVWGIERVKERVKLARKNNLKVYTTNLNRVFLFENDSINCITATEVIEHLRDVDNFLSECKRVLKKDGSVIISTENLAGWQNVFSLILGNQPYTGPYLSKFFSVVDRPSGKFYNCSRKITLLSVNELNCFELAEGVAEDTMGLPMVVHKHSLPMDPHLNVMTRKALVRLLKMYGFSRIESVGIGFLPLPYPLSWVMSYVDKNHASYVVVKAVK